MDNHQGGPHGRSLSQFLYHEATESIATPPGWNASPSQGFPQQYFARTHLYTWVERDNVE